MEAFRPQSNALRCPEGPCEIEDRLVTALLGGRLALLFLHMAFQTILGLDSSYLFTIRHFIFPFLFFLNTLCKEDTACFVQSASKIRERAKIYFNSLNQQAMFLQSADKLQVQEEKQEFKMHPTARKIISNCAETKVFAMLNFFATFPNERKRSQASSE